MVWTEVEIPVPHKVEPRKEKKGIYSLNQKSNRHRFTSRRFLHFHFPKANNVVPAGAKGWRDKGTPRGQDSPFLSAKITAALPRGCLSSKMGEFQLWFPCSPLQFARPHVSVCTPAHTGREHMFWMGSSLWKCVFEAKTNVKHSLSKYLLLKAFPGLSHADMS